MRQMRTKCAIKQAGRENGNHKQKGNKVKAENP